MNNISSFKKKFPWRLMAFLAIGVTVAALAPYATFNPDKFNNATSRFAGETPLRLAGLYIHAFGGGIALIIGHSQLHIQSMTY